MTSKVTTRTGTAAAQADVAERLAALEAAVATLELLVGALRQDIEVLLSERPPAPPAPPIPDDPAVGRSMGPPRAILASWDAPMRSQRKALVTTAWRITRMLEEEARDRLALATARWLAGEPLGFGSATRADLDAAWQRRKAEERAAYRRMASESDDLHDLQHMMDLLQRREGLL